VISNLDDLFASSHQIFVELVMSKNKYIPIERQTTALYTSIDGTAFDSIKYTSPGMRFLRLSSLRFGWDRLLDSEFSQSSDRFTRSRCHRFARGERRQMQVSHLIFQANFLFLCFSHHGQHYFPRIIF